MQCRSGEHPRTYSAYSPKLGVRGRKLPDMAFQALPELANQHFINWYYWPRPPNTHHWDLRLFLCALGFTILLHRYVERSGYITASYMYSNEPNNNRPGDPLLWLKVLLKALWCIITYKPCLNRKASSQGYTGNSGRNLISPWAGG